MEIKNNFSSYYFKSFFSINLAVALLLLIIILYAALQKYIKSVK